MKFKFKLAVFLLFLFIIPLQTLAITVSPAVIELEAEKGQAIEQKIKVSNQADEELILYISVEAFDAAGETNMPKEEISLPTWISFASDQVTLPANKSIEVPFRINLPSYASPGGHYATVFFSQKKDATGESRVGSLIFVNIAGQIVEDANLSEFSSVVKESEQLVVGFNLDIKNNGNSHIKPVGSIKIYKKNGEYVDEIKVNELNQTILPGQERGFFVSWPAEGTKLTKDFLGEYIARVELYYGNQGNTVSSKTDFEIRQGLSKSEEFIFQNLLGGIVNIVNFLRKF